MRVTIITITKDDREGLCSTVASVAEQEGADFEYIIVNGGRASEIHDVVARYSGVITSVLARQAMGIADAFNWGASHATGELVLFLNSGDIFSARTSLRDAINEIMESTDWRNRVFCGHFRYCGAGMSRTMAPRPGDLDRHCSIGHQAAFTGIEVLRRLWFDGRFRTAMDYDFWLRCKAIGVPFVVISTVVADFSEGGVSSSTDRVIYNEMSREVCQFLEVYRQYRWRDLARFFAVASWALVRLRSRAVLGTRITYLYRRMRYRREWYV